MRESAFLVALICLPLWAQEPPKPQDAMDKAAAAAKAAVEQSPPPAATTAQPVDRVKLGTENVPYSSIMNFLALPPTQVVATIDGNKVTAGDLQMVLRGLPPQAQQAAVKDGRQFLEQYGVMHRLSAEAEKSQLDQQSPWKEQLHYMRVQMLAQARIDQKFNEIQIPPDELNKTYEATKDRFYQAKVKDIYIPFSQEPVSQADPKGKKILTEAEAQAKAADLVKLALSGVDFVKLVKENSEDQTSVSKDGDLGVLKKTDRLPDVIKTAIFNAKAGDVVGPIRQAKGFYVLKIEELGPQPVADAQSIITNELRDVRFREWLNSVQKSVDIKEESVQMTSEAVRVPKSSPPAPQAPTPKD